MNEFKSFYKTVGGGEGDKCYYPTRLDPYGRGCYYNCSYCYAKSLLDFRKLWNINPAVADFEKIKKVINKKIPSGSVVRLGGMTDCFQPIEETIKNTYRIIKLLNDKEIHYLIVTKSNLIARDDYIDILHHDYAHIQISIATNDNNVLSQTDNAPTFEERKSAIEKLYRESFDVSLRLAPFIYNTVDFDVINNIKVDKCLVEFLRVKPKMKESLGKIINFDDYILKEGGYRHLPLQTKNDIIDKLNFKQLSVCDDVQEHYDYFTKNVNYNPNDCCNLSLKS